jgi:hypothetical protein
MVVQRFQFIPLHLAALRQRQQTLRPRGRSAQLRAAQGDAPDVAGVQGTQDPRQQILAAEALQHGDGDGPNREMWGIFLNTKIRRKLNEMWF